ncbi:MAG: sensor histidine kinase [Gemmatimonadota bacterium]
MRARLRPWLLYWLAWIPIAGLYTAALAAEISSSDAIVGGVLAALVAGSMGVGIWWLSGRLPWPDRKRGRFVLIQFFAALAFAAIWVGTIWGRVALEVGWETTRRILGAEVGWSLIMGLWLFGVITGVSYVIRGQQRIREQQKAVERAEALRAQAELQALKARLHPHFLFNTLHGVKSLVRRDPARAEVAIERLGDLLRSLLGRGEETDDVPLEEELAFVRKYLALEELRLGDRLRVVERVEADSLECGVPPLILQPLVENAIRHGIAPRGGGGTLRLTARLRNGDLVVGVSDDGPGSADADLEGAAGLGLRTVRQRLEAGFGRRARLEIETAAGKGFAVTLSLPARAFVPLDVATRDGQSEIGP